MKRGDDASHESPGAAHVLLIGVVDVRRGLLYSLGRAPRARRRRRHGVVVHPIHMFDALQPLVVRRPARRGAARAGGRGSGRDADRRAHRRLLASAPGRPWPAASLGQPELRMRRPQRQQASARERCACKALWGSRGQSHRSACEAYSPRTSHRREASVENRNVNRTGFTPQKHKEGSHKGRRERRYTLVWVVSLGL